MHLLRCSTRRQTFPFRNWRTFDRSISGVMGRKHRRFNFRNGWCWLVRVMESERFKLERFIDNDRGWSPTIVSTKTKVGAQLLPFCFGWDAGAWRCHEIFISTRCEGVSSSLAIVIRTGSSSMVLRVFLDDIDIDWRPHFPWTFLSWYHRISLVPPVLNNMKLTRKACFSRISTP